MTLPVNFFDDTGVSARKEGWNYPGRVFFGNFRPFPRYEVIPWLLS